MDGHAAEQVAESPLAAECPHEGLPPEERQNAGRDAPAQVDAPGGQNLERQVARLGSQDGHKHLQGPDG